MGASSGPSTQAPVKNPLLNASIDSMAASRDDATLSRDEKVYVPESAKSDEQQQHGQVILALAATVTATIIVAGVVLGGAANGDHIW
eukprot:COSAG01_NODE_4478_length_4986_cov_3.398813_8_plen_87_part_00